MDKEALIAAKKANLKKLKELVDRGINVNAQDDNGRTLLHQAVSNNQPDVVKYLLENGADVLLTTDKGNTALHIAVVNTNKYKDDAIMVRTILENVVGLDELRKLLDMKTKATGTAAIHVAVKNDYLNTIICLLASGCKFQIKNNAGQMPVDLTNREELRRSLQVIDKSFGYAKNGDERLISDLVHLIIKDVNDFDIVWMILFNCRNNKGHTIIQELLLNEHYWLIPELLIWAWHQPKIFVAWSFVSKNNCEIDRLVKSIEEFQEFWRQKRDATTASSSDLTERHVGSMIVRIINASPRDTVASLKIACKALKKVHKLFVAYRKLFKIKNSHKIDPSMRTVEDALEILGFNPEELFVIDGEDASTSYGKKLPLKYKNNIARLLNVMSNGIDLPLSFILKHVYTLQIFQTVKADDVRKVKYLLKNGANVHVTDQDGRTACCYAVEKGNKKMIKLLFKTNPIIAADGYISPICLAINNGDVKVVKRILEGIHPTHMAKFIDYRNKCKSTPLHEASKKGRLDIVKILLSHGATYLIFDENGQTPLNVSTSEDVSDFLKIIDECFQDAKKANDELVFKLKALQNDEFIAVASTRNDEGQTLAVVAAKAGAKNVAVYILKMIKETKQEEE